MNRSSLFFVCLIGGAGAWNITAASNPNYHLVGECKIGGENRWDYLYVDSTTHRLFVTHGTSVAVLDLASNQVTGTLENTPGVHGIAVAPEAGRIFSSNGRDSQAGMFDAKTFKRIGSVPTGENPDAILYVPVTKEVYAFNGRGHSATVFDAASGKVSATIELGGKPEYAVFDPSSTRIFNNLEDKNELIGLDIQTHTITNRWPIAPGEAASGLALDSANQRLFLGCGNKMMVMMDARSGKVIAHVPIGEGVDATAYDAATHLAFASCGGDGTVTIADASDPKKLRVAQILKTQRSARTMALDPQTHRIYLSAAEPNAGEEGKRRPGFKPDTFKVLIYGQE